MKIWQQLVQFLGILILAILIFIAGGILFPKIFVKAEPTPLKPDTIRIETVMEDTSKTNNLTRKLARACGFEKLYNDLFARYMVRRADTVYQDTTLQKISLDLRFIIRVDKTSKNLDVWTAHITNIEGNSGTIVDKIRTAIKDVTLNTLDAQGYLSRIPFTLSKADADFQLFATKGVPKLIEIRQPPFHLSLFVGGVYNIVPDHQITAQSRINLDFSKVNVNLGYETWKRVYLGAEYKWRFF